MIQWPLVISVAVGVFLGLLALTLGVIAVTVVADILEKRRKKQDMPALEDILREIGQLQRAVRHHSGLIDRHGQTLDRMRAAEPIAEVAGPFQRPTGSWASEFAEIDHIPLGAVGRDAILRATAELAGLDGQLSDSRHPADRRVDDLDEEPPESEPPESEPPSRADHILDS